MQQDAGLKQGQNGRDSEVSLCVSGALERGLVYLCGMYFPCLCMKGGPLTVCCFLRRFFVERRKRMDSSSLLQILCGLQSIRWTKQCSEFVTEALVVHQLLGFVFVPVSQLWMGRRMVCQLAVQQQTLPKTLKTFCDGILGGGWLCTGEMLHTIPLDGAVVPLECPYVLSCRSICWTVTCCLAAVGHGLGNFLFAWKRRLSGPYLCLKSGTTNLQMGILL